MECLQSNIPSSPPEGRFADTAPSLGKLQFNFSTSSAQPTVIEKTELQFDIRAILDTYLSTPDTGRFTHNSRRLISFIDCYAPPLLTYCTSLAIIYRQYNENASEPSGKIMV